MGLAPSNRVSCAIRRADMKDVLNSKISGGSRSGPSRLQCCATRCDWFRNRRAVHDAGVSDPRATGASARRDARRWIGRLQTVTRASNPLYYGLIAAFGRLTGVPMI
jgi:hypothetical protein